MFQCVFPYSYSSWAPIFFYFWFPTFFKICSLMFHQRKKMHTVLKRYGGWIFIFEGTIPKTVNLLLICIVVISVQLCCSIESLLLFIGYCQLFLKIRTENDCKWLFQDGWCVLWVRLTKWTHVTQITNKLVCVLIQGREVWIACFGAVSHNTSHSDYVSGQ